MKFSDIESNLIKAFSKSKKLKVNQKKDLFLNAQEGLKGIYQEVTREYFITFCEEFEEMKANKSKMEMCEMVLISNPNDQDLQVLEDFKTTQSEYKRLLRNMRNRINAILKVSGYKVERTSDIKKEWVSSVIEKNIVPFNEKGEIVPYTSYLLESNIKIHSKKGKRTNALRFIQKGKDYTPQLTELTKAYLDNSNFEINQKLTELTNSNKWESLEKKTYKELLGYYSTISRQKDNKLKIYRLLKQKAKFSKIELTPQEQTEKALKDIKSQIEGQNKKILVNSVMTFREYFKPVIKPYYTIIKQ